MLSAAAVFVAIGSAVVAQPSSWEASVSLEVRALPQREVDQVADRLALSSPAIVEAVRSPTIVRAAASDAGAVHPERVVADSVRVDIMTKPGSVTLTVTRPDPVEARRLVVALARQVVDLDLLTPQARLVIISPVIEVVETEPRGSVALLAAVGAAAACGLGICLLHGAASRGVRSLADLRRITGAFGATAVDARDGTGRSDEVESLGCWIGAPPLVTITTVGRIDSDEVDDIARRLRAATARGPHRSSTVVVVSRGTSADLVRAGIAGAGHGDLPVCAVLLR